MQKGQSREPTSAPDIALYKSDKTLTEESCDIAFLQILPCQLPQSINPVTPHVQYLFCYVYSSIVRLARTPYITPAYGMTTMFKDTGMQT